MLLNNSNLPLVLALIITLILQGAVYMLPLPEADLLPKRTTTLGKALTGSSQVNEVEEIIVKQLDSAAYISALPFELSVVDQKSIQSTFSELSKALATETDSEVKSLSLKIESILHPYWFKDDVKNKFINFELDRFYLIHQDFDNLSKDLEEIKDMDQRHTPEILYKTMGQFSKDYYKAINNVLELYKEELVKNTFIHVRSEKNSEVIKTGGTSSSVTYDYSTFLYSRAFELSNDDMDTIYYLFTAYKKSPNDEDAQSIQQVLKPYWFKQSVLDTIIPMDLYRSGAFTNLDPTQVSQLNAQYEVILQVSSTDPAENLLDEIIIFNNLLGESLNTAYINIYTSFDLQKILNTKENANEFKKISMSITKFYPTTWWCNACICR